MSLVIFVVVMAQIVREYFLRDDSREDEVWDACVHPGELP